MSLLLTIGKNSAAAEFVCVLDAHSFLTASTAEVVNRYLIW
jgi:hypothetical protein